MQWVLQRIRETLSFLHGETTHEKNKRKQERILVILVPGGKKERQVFGRKSSPNKKGVKPAPVVCDDEKRIRKALGIALNLKMEKKSEKNSSRTPHTPLYNLRKKISHIPYFHLTPLSVFREELLLCSLGIQDPYLKLHRLVII